ncbi:hypothetical protein HJG60_011357 [Phyllostomus discolor]|uniref:Uncharacterized protein n=1 Tax=Phyllostomus discolor TaxID=89673 RepID=A0A834E5C4_9CHIR|nr:hypothetical protein HJG60_011357 [Phyllostomus discolor]
MLNCDRTQRSASKAPTPLLVIDTDILTPETCKCYLLCKRDCSDVTLRWGDCTAEEKTMCWKTSEAVRENRYLTAGCECGERGQEPRSFRNAVLEARKSKKNGFSPGAYPQSKKRHWHLVFSSGKLISDFRLSRIARE